MSVKIREFEIDDFANVLSLWRRAGLTISPSDTPEGIKKKLERDPDLFIVAEEDGNIVEAVMGAYDGRRAWINHLAVAPERQKIGLGAALLAEVEVRLKARACEKVNLHIYPGNAGVVGFYERVGYNRAELIFMEKWLTRGGPDAE